MKVQRTVTVTLGGTRCSVGEMLEFLADFPDDALLNIRYTNFDASPDPREFSYVTLEVRYS